MASVTIISIIQRNNSRVATTKLDDELVMMDLENGAYIRLNKMAVVIWEQMETPLLVKQMVSKLVGHYNVDESLCKKEVLACLNKMSEQNIVICH